MEEESLEERPLGMTPSRASNTHAACLLRPRDPARWVEGYDCRLTYRREWDDQSCNVRKEILRRYWCYWTAQDRTGQDRIGQDSTR